MTTIRMEQLDAFQQARRTAFDKQMAETFRPVWPDRVAHYGDAYRHVIHEAIDRAYGYGIELDCDVARFVNLTLAWGLGFEDQPQHTWAKRILTDTSQSAGLRVNQLYEESQQRVQGDDDDDVSDMA